MRAPGRGAMAPLISIAAAARMFIGLNIEYDAVGCAAWLCPLIAFVLCVPLLWGMQAIADAGNTSAWLTLTHDLPKAVVRAVALIFSLMLLYDCALNARLIAATANTLALSHISEGGLLVPLLITLGLAICLGADACGNGAGIWLKLLPILFIIIIAVQIKHYEPAWLTPVLGKGLPSIVNGSLACAGWMSLAALCWLTALPDREKGPLMRIIALAALAAAVLLILWQMLAPTAVGMPLSHDMRLELLIGSGRTATSLQLVTTLVWYGSMLTLLACEGASVGVYLNTVLPVLPRAAVGGAVALAVYILARLRLSEYQGAALARELYFIAIGGAAALLLLRWICSKREVKRSCKASAK